MRDLKEVMKALQEMAPDDFRQWFINTCQTYHENGNVLAFGTIMYDESTPEMRKMLRDDDYWDALDKLSGKNLLVLALRDRPAPSPKADLSQHFMLGAVLSDPSLRLSISDNYSLLVQRVFGLDVTISYPSLLLFQVCEDELYEHILIKLPQESVTKSYERLKVTLSLVGQVLGDILRENYGNKKEIFAQIRTELENRRINTVLWQVIQRAPRVAELLTSFFPGKPGS